MATRLSFAAAVAGLAAAAILGSAAPAKAATATIGQTGPSAGCLPDYTFWQLSGSASYTVPAGSWTLTSWSTEASSYGGQMALVVLRPQGGSNYSVVGVSTKETLTPSTLNTFTTSIAVQGGDIVGLWTSGGTCAQSTGSSGDTYEAWFGATPSAGDTLSPGGSPLTGFLMDLSATLVSDEAAAGATRLPDHVFLCYSTFEQDGGAVFEVADAEALLALGYWLPSAVAGNVPGGDNLGAYHLLCNPPAEMKPTGWYVDDSGEPSTLPQAGPYAVVG